MRGGGRGGGGRLPSYAPPDGADAAAIPAASMKMVQSLKGILADRSEGEIYATLCDCGMDPDIAVERLISQDTFHEVRRKRDKKETKVNQETRPQQFQKSIYQGYKAGPDRSGRDSTGGFKGPVKKELELHAPLNSALDVKSSDTAETFSATGNVAQADAKNTTSQPPPQLQHGWGGIPGRPSMAEIVKMGRPQAKVGSRSVARGTTMPAVGDSVISNTPNLSPKEYNKSVVASEVGHVAADKLPDGVVEVQSVPKDASSLDMLPSAEGTDVEAPSMKMSCLPSRILLDELGYIDDEGDHIDDEGNCSNEVTTADLRGITISFFAADPPHLSHFIIHGPSPSKNPPLRGRPRILHSVGNLLLISITSSAGGLNYVEYFIYKHGRRPSLKHLEHISNHLHQVTAVSSVGILPLTCDGNDNFAVVALALTGGYHYGLHVFRPEQGTWISKIHSLDHDLVANIQLINIEKVVLFPTREIAFVDLWKGILVFSILHDQLVSHFIPLPNLLSGNQSENQLGSSARSFRDVIISVDSFLKCVEVEGCWQRILHEGPQVSVSSESPMDTEEVEEYGYLGWKVISWSRDLSATCWRKEFSFCAQDITPAALEECGAHVLTLQDSYVSFPTLSVDSSILYIFLKANMVDKEFRVAMVDMGNNSVTGFSPRLIERPIFSPSYNICDLFKYDLGNNRYAGEEFDIESFSHDAADVDKGGNSSANNYPPPLHYRCSDLSCFCNSFLAPPQQSDLNGDVSTETIQFDHLTLHEGPKVSDDNPAVIIPDHLQVSNADCAHLTFGSFVSGTLDASLTTKSLDSHGDVATVPDDDSMDQSDGRIHDDESKVTLAPAANGYVTSAANSNVENLDITSAQQSEVTRANFLDVTSNTEYNLSSTPDYATSSAALQDSASQSYLQENRQFQNISPLSSFMQIQNGLLPPTIPPLREFDPAFSLLLTNPPMMHGTMSSSMSNATVSTQPQENANPVGLPNPQLTQSQPSTSIAAGPPLPQHVHPSAQATLPLGYASMIGYPCLPPSHAYLPPAAFQQPYMNSGLFHQAAAAVPNSSVKYPLPQYRSNIALASFPQPGSLLSSYVGGFGTANYMPGNFPLNQSTTSATTTLGFDGTVPSHFKDGNQFISLQQNENPAMWMHGAGSRGMPPLAASTMYGYQGQSHQAGLRQGQLPSQFGSALGQSQPGLGPEHRNPSDSNLSGAAQANQMWPNSY